MPFVIELEEGEAVVFEEFVQFGNSDPFAFVVTNRALYLPGKKFAVRDPYTFRRVPLAEVENMILANVPPYSYLALAACMIVFGGLASYFMMHDLLAGERRTVSGIPIALVVVGALIPFFVRSRQSLEVRYAGGSFKWKQPLLFGASATKRRYQAALRRILESCQQLGVHTLDATSSSKASRSALSPGPQSDG